MVNEYADSIRATMMLMVCRVSIIFLLLGFFSSLSSCSTCILPSSGGMGLIGESLAGSPAIGLISSS